MTGLLPDLRPHIAEIARAILGEPNKRLSTRTQLRFGSNGSVAVEIVGEKRGEWYDHEQQVGGGPWELLTVKARMTDGDAIGWLQSRIGIETIPAAKNARNPVATYDYRDERGDLLFQVCRFEPKTFRQRRPHSKGGWEWNVKGVRQVPYRLPELIAAPTDCVVFVVEGEKDADRLASLGLVATCYPGGAGKWQSSFSQFFQGRVVVVLPDNDDAGRIHARKFGDGLAAVAGRVRILELPDLPPKGDVSDWLNTGGSREGLERLAADAPAFSLDDDGHKADDQAEILDDEVEIRRLAKLSSLAYERDREPVAKQLGFRVSALDRLVKAERSNGAAIHGRGQPVELFEPEPWYEPVDGAALLNQLTITIQRYVILGLHQARAVALWVLFTHAFAVAAFAPKLIITSPQKRSGKTRLLQVLGYLVPRAKATSQITSAALFRLITDYTPTLLIDEADAFMRDNEELRGILNSGFDKRTATVTRNVPNGEGWEARDFSTWCPQAIAGIGSLPDTIVDRSFVVALKRKLSTETVARLRERDADPLRELACKTARWTADHRYAIEMADPELPAALDDRAADAWSLPVGIADVVGGDWPKLARQTALALSGEVADESPGVQLLADLRELFEREASGVLFTKEILVALSKDENRPWPEWKNGRPITDRQLAALLRPFKVRPKSVRRGDDTDKGYRREWLDDAFARYLSALQSVTASQAAEMLGPSLSSSVTSTAIVTDRVDSKTAESLTCDGVTDRSPLWWRDDGYERPALDPEEAQWTE
jgi:putative DNA primase/helicase